MIEIRLLLTLSLLAALLYFVACEEKKDKKPQHPKLDEYSREAPNRPTKCQVCRILAQELGDELNKTSKIKESLWLTNRLDDNDEARDEKKGKKIDYKKSEIRLMDTLETVCNNVYNYRSIAGPDFPYLKDVKSMFRQQLEEMVGMQGLALKLDAPEELIEDPTFELKRMQVKCQQMVEDHEDEIIDWYMNHQESSLIDFVCKDQILAGEDTSCLTASTDVPDFAKAPLPKDKSGVPVKKFTKDRGEL